MAPEGDTLAPFSAAFRHHAVVWWKRLLQVAFFSHTMFLSSVLKQAEYVRTSQNLSLRHAGSTQCFQWREQSRGSPCLPGSWAAETALWCARRALNAGNTNRCMPCCLLASTLLTTRKAASQDRSRTASKHMKSVQSVTNTAFLRALDAGLASRSMQRYRSGQAINTGPVSGAVKPWLPSPKRP